MRHALGDVTNVEHDALDRGIVEQVDADHLDRDPRSVLVVHPVRERLLGTRTLRHELGQRGDCRVEIVGVQELEAHPADELVVLPPEHAGHGQARELDRRVGSDHDDGVGRVGDERDEALLGVVLGRDVGERPGEPGHDVAVAGRLREVQHPAHRAVGVYPAVLDVEVVDVVEGAGELVRDRVGVIGVEAGAPTVPEGSVHRHARDLGPALVHVDAVELGVHLEEADRGALDEGAVPLSFSSSHQRPPLRCRVRLNLLYRSARVPR